MIINYFDEPKRDVPSKELFLSQKRSTEIRSVCIQILQNINCLLHDPHSQTNVSSHSQEEKLKSLGIITNIHKGDDPETFLSDPIKAAEYVAGQVMNLLSHRIASEGDVITDIEKISMGEKEGVQAAIGFFNFNQSGTQSPEVMGFAAARATLNILSSMLDAQDEVSLPGVGDESVEILVIWEMCLDGKSIH